MNAQFPSAPRLLLDSGNYSDNPTSEGDAKTRALLKGMELMGYDAVNVGERDVRLGYAEFARLSEGRSLRFLSANIVRQDTKAPIFEPHVVLDAVSPDGRRKLRVGVIGAVRFNPIFLKAGPDDSSLVIARPAERVAQEVEALRGKGVDRIILLAAMHKADATRLVEQVGGIDLVLGSYGGLYTPQPEQVNDTWILYTGNRGQRLIEARLYDEARPALVARAHFLNREYPFDEALLAFVASAVGGDPMGEEDDAGEGAEDSAGPGIP